MQVGERIESPELELNAQVRRLPVVRQLLAHQERHRSLRQGLIDLKRLYWNCRALAEGKRKERCPYEHLGLRLPTCDWWELLQMSPDELEQKLSSTKLAA